MEKTENYTLVGSNVSQRQDTYRKCQYKRMRHNCSIPMPFVLTQRLFETIRYVEYGFTSLLDELGGPVRAQCMTCHFIICNSNLKPCRLQEHRISNSASPILVIFHPCSTDVLILVVPCKGVLDSQSLTKGVLKLKKVKKRWLTVSFI